MFGVVDSRWKHIRFEAGGEALFDLVADPNELENVIESNQKVAARMRNQLADFKAQYGAQAPPAREISPEMIKMLKALGY